MNWITFAQDHGIPIIDEGPELTDGWLGIDCPFCSPNSGGFHLGIPPQGSSTSCWKCGVHSNIDTIQQLISCSPEQARSYMYKYKHKGDKLYRIPKVINFADSITLPTTQIFSTQEVTYMISRGITPEIVAKHSIRSGGTSGLWRNRIVIPITYKGSVISATGRAITDSLTPRYYTLPHKYEVKHHKDYLFNIDNCKSRTIALVEGPLDAIMLGDNSAATYGVSVTDKQLINLIGYTRILCIFDQDKVGGKARNRYAHIIASMIDANVEVITFKGYKDTGGMPMEQILELRKELRL